MINFNDIKEVLQAVADAQEADNDIRTRVRAAHDFIEKPDGQWERDVSESFNDRPQYTFDICTPLVDQVSGEMDNADFTLRVKPSGGDASKDTAKLYDGLIRNIRNISNAEHVFSAAGRNMVIGGMDGWEIKQDFVDGDAFEQDLFIRKIHNFVDRVWFLGMPEEQDNSDAEAVVVMSTMAMAAYEEQFPKGSKEEVATDRDMVSYTNKVEHMVIGKLLYKKPRDIEIVLMTDGSVYQVDEKFETVVDELMQQGITEVKRRVRKGHRVYSRIFNGKEFLTESEETVFDYLPVVAAYGNFNITDNKRICSGLIEKAMDAAMVRNYALSRDIEEGALSPREKFWLTPEQAKGQHATLSKLNTSIDPVQFYNHTEGQPPPYKTPGATPNQALQTTAMNMSESINATAGLFSASMGDNPGLQSGVAIDRQISKGDNGTIKWFSAMEVALAYTGKILVNAIPRVFDSTRMIRVLAEDGSFEMSEINKKVQDQQTGQIIELNNLSSGQYDVTCERGLAFASKQKEAAAAFTEMAAIDPSIIEMAKDVYYNNLDAPGMDLIADRARLSLLMNGGIPEEQQKDEEKQMLAQIQEQQANQPPQEDPMMIAAQAEMQKAQAEQMTAQNKTQETQMNGQVKMADVEVRKMQVQLDQQKLQLDVEKFMKSQDDKLNIAAATIDQGQQRIDLDVQKMMNDMSLKLTDMEQKYQQQLDGEMQSNMLVFDAEVGDFIASH